MFYVNLLYTKINDEYTSQDPPVTEVTLKIVLDWQNSKNRVGTSRVSTGIPGYGLHTEIIWNFFPFPLWKRFRKTGIPERFLERFFFRKKGISETLFRNYGSLRNSGISFWKFSGISFSKFSGKSFRKFPVSGTIGTIITLKSYICKYNSS